MTVAYNKPNTARSKRELKKMRSKVWHLYVLLLEHGYYYVGISRDVHKRFKEHQEGNIKFTTRHKPERIFIQFSCGTEVCSEAEQLEKKMTLLFAQKFGSDKVFGAGFRWYFKDGVIVPYER